MATKRKTVAKKKAAKKQRQVVVELVFTQAILNELLKYATFGDRTPRKVQDMTEAEFKRFAKEIKSTPFMDEILDGSREACANDWLCDWGPKDDDEDDSDDDFFERLGR